MGEPRHDHPAIGAALPDATGAGHPVQGTVRIAPAVLIELIELTLRDIDGVAGLRPRRDRRAAPDAPDSRTWETGPIAVTISGDRIDAAVAVAIHRGANVAELVPEIQRRIGFAAGNMLGMTVRTVDLAIEEIVAAPASAT